MSTLALAVFLSALVAGAGAQTSPASSSNATVWAAVAFVMHGERTPELGPLARTITPIGAQQMYAQGSAFRSRYLLGNNLLNDTERGITARAPIHDIERNAIDNFQLSILTSTDSWVTQGATAFMQGLYPPIVSAFPANVGGLDISRSAVTGIFTDYPLDGYQYPDIEALSVLEETNIYVQGHAGCPNYRESVLSDVREEPSMLRLYQQTLPFYQSIFSKDALKGTIPLANANLWDAYNLYDFVRYNYYHNSTVNRGLGPEGETLLLQLRALAEDQQIAMNSNKTASGEFNGDMIRTVAGRTWAQKVLDQFSDNQIWGGTHNKLTVMFGSYEPFLAFFSLARLMTGTSGDEFLSLPEPGAAMIFELIGDEPGEPGEYPSWENMKVRFVYRMNTNGTTPFLEHAVFGYGNAAHVMPYRDFVAEMKKFTLDVNAWCTMCDSIQLFCTGRRSNSGSGTRTNIIYSTSNPVIAGVIGAVVTISVIGAAVIIGLVLGLRVHKREKPGLERNSGLGGFKGAEKMASDTDLAVSRAGAHHERIGSWELRDGKNVADETVMTTHAFGRKQDDDAISVLGATPVKPRESF